MSERNLTDVEQHDPGPYPEVVAPCGFIYFVRCLSGRFVKIGIASNLGSRFSQLQNGCPFELRLVAWMWSERPRAHEEMLHAAFASDRERGEWFRPSSRLDELIMLCAKERSLSAERALVGRAFEWRGVVREWGPR